MEACVERRSRSSVIVHFRIPQRLLVSSTDDDDVQLQFNICNVDGREEWMFLLDVAESVSFAVPIPLRPGYRFTLNGRLLRRWLAPPLDGGDQNGLTQSGPVTPVVRVGYKTIDSAQAVFRVELTVEEIRQLRMQSISFMSLQHRPSNLLYVPCHYFYRNKPHEYFNNIFCMEACVERRSRSSVIVHFRIPQRLLVSSTDDDDVQLQLNICNVDGREEWMFLLDVAESVSFAVPIPLRPGYRFTLNGRLLRRWLAPPLDGGDQNGLTQSGPVTPVVRVGYKTIDSAQAVFRVELTVEEIRQLLMKSISFMSLQHRPSNLLYVPCHYFYRNKPREYFNNIFCYQAGIMTVYRKNKNGDPASPINGQLDGLFFGVNVDLTTGLPVVPSLYGPTRLSIKSCCMFQLAPNVYFCDFYCHYKSHHVTLVMTKPGSAADTFCKSRLKLLDNFQNLFLYIDSKSQTVFVTIRVWVQVFFTENIDLGCVLLNEYGFIDDVPSQPVPATTVEGVPKNPLCSICNIN